MLAIVGIVLISMHHSEVFKRACPTITSPNVKNSFSFNQIFLHENNKYSIQTTIKSCTSGQTLVYDWKDFLILKVVNRIFLNFGDLMKAKN